MLLEVTKYTKYTKPNNVNSSDSETRKTFSIFCLASWDLYVVILIPLSVSEIENKALIQKKNSQTNFHY